MILLTWRWSQLQDNKKSKLEGLKQRELIGKNEKVIAAKITASD